MFRSFIVIFCSLYFIGFFCSGNAAITEEQRKKVHELFEGAGLKCIQSDPISEDDIKDLKAHNEPKGENVPCFMACMMKDIGVMDSDGKFQKEKIVNIAKSILDDDGMKQLEEYTQSCAHINEEDLDSCGRAMEAYKCMKQYSSQFFGQ